MDTTKTNLAKPKSQTSAYAFFMKATREEVKNNSSMSFSEFSKHASEKWKNISADDMKTYEEMAARDSIRYEEEMANYALSDGEKVKENETKDFKKPEEVCEKLNNFCDVDPKKYNDTETQDVPQYEEEMVNSMSTESTKKRKRNAKDANAPKTALFPYVFFAIGERPKIKKEFPNMRFTEVAKELGRRWKLCTNRGKYETMAAKDKERYEMEKDLSASGSMVEADVSPVIEQAISKNTRAYHNFAHKERPKIKTAFPTMPFTEVAKELGRRWQSYKNKENDLTITAKDIELKKSSSISGSDSIAESDGLPSKEPTASKKSTKANVKPPAKKRKIEIKRDNDDDNNEIPFGF